ncbi:hypothetical protein A73_249 [Escherichia phage A73]|uniref:Uncharacterized protein n=1 Tax=Escherichia phage A73 TaxID=3003819 RepID=A0AAE9W0N8_9CAUD|nr:hypothetical protein A73_249 [Escherichia phage A73]WBF77957.1 hypothetical protein W70_234 [Escherichia phage W70]
MIKFMNRFVNRYRIVLIEYNHTHAGKKVTYALQKRIGFFFWYTMTKCDSKSQTEYYYSKVKDKSDKLIKIIGYRE